MEFARERLSAIAASTARAPNVVQVLRPYQERSDALVRKWIQNIAPLHMMALIEDAVSPGRRIRPSLQLLLIDLCSSANNDRDRQECEQVALAVELLHRASIIADDIIDRDRTRRQSPTFHVDHGESVAIIIAHFLASAAIGAVVDIAGIRKTLVQTYSDMCIGQLADVRSVVQRGTALETYKHLVLKKTCGPFGLIFSAAAEFSRQDTTIAKTLGCMLGSVYQMANDHYDVLCAPDDERGQPRNHLLTLTLPLALAVDAGFVDPGFIGQPTEPSIMKTITKRMYQTSIFDSSAVAVESTVQQVLLMAKKFPEWSQVIEDFCLWITSSGYWNHAERKLGTDLFFCPIAKK